MINITTKKFITCAINLAKKNQGSTFPNPSVGCVITVDNKIISTGITAKGGRPHAEINAIEKVRDKSILKEATIYISLEPCCHQGKTGPCCDEIIKYSFKKVVIAAIDPDQRVSGKSVKILKEAGIEVETHILEKEATAVNRDFFKVKLTGLPFVSVKIATSLDGKIATISGDSKWISSDKARYYTNYLRSKSNAILIGANTARIDNPSLDCRIPGLEDRSPIKIILSKDLDLKHNLKIFSSKEVYIASPKNNSSKFNIIEVAAKKDKVGEIDLRKFLKKINQELGINSLLVEGGANVVTQFLQEDLVDEIVWVRSKKIIGNDGKSAFGNLNTDRIGNAINNFNRFDLTEFEYDVIETFRKSL